MERTITYFGKPGPTNTDTTLRLAAEQAGLRGIGKVLIASTRGFTAKRAAKVFAGTGIKLIVVPHQYGFTEKQLFPPDLVADLEQQGHTVHFGTMLFHTDKFYGSAAPETMAMILRTICQGMKVCVEITLMAADGGHVARGEEVIVVSGTRRGPTPRWWPWQPPPATCTTCTSPRSSASPCRRSRGPAAPARTTRRIADGSEALDRTREGFVDGCLPAG